ncbi:hypothetical protein [Rhizobium leguminosarum]|uniref:hypothetical protein n=1 Tax=Rhizobium leguminosarum TaxID=384 RepID=UPI0034A49A11
MHGERALVVVLGDYLDSGRRSRDVGRSPVPPSSCRHTRIALCGNHEEAFRRLLVNRKLFQSRRALQVWKL